jgi:beta-galactosidase
MVKSLIASTRSWPAVMLAAMQTPLALPMRIHRSLAVLGVFAAVATSALCGADALRERTLFNEGWRFHRGEAPDEAGALDYKQIRPWLLATGTDLIDVGVTKPTRPDGNPGEYVSYVQPGFDDQDWTALTLPHDWAIAGPFSQDLPGETGKLPWQGTGWYRKHFKLSEADKGQQIALDIDGAMAYSGVWLNGRYVGGWPYGYASYRLDLTPYVKFGDDNVLAIRLHNPKNSSRWYPGSGIYRNVWLVKTPPIRIRHWGVFVTTPRITAQKAIANVDVYIESVAAGKNKLLIKAAAHELRADGTLSEQPVALGSSNEIELDTARARDAMRSVRLDIANPKLWDVASPNRYVVVTTIEADGKVIDRETTPFGIRSVAWDADNGFLLNGRRVQFQGVCMHHDLGALGAAINTRALERQVEILKSMGVNAIRTSHNPPAPELLELCDRLGILVMDEAFDMWRRSKKDTKSKSDDPYDRAHDYARVFDEWHERDMRAFIRRDRNHPSVVIWSIGNEVIEQWFSDGWQVATRLAGIVREEDRTRPITSAMNGVNAAYAGFQTAIDAAGFNYKPEAYAPFHQAHPTVPTYSSESASTLSTRGEYFFPVEPKNKHHGQQNFQVSSYDLSTARWANTPDVEWEGLDRAPYTAGEFVWTGFDYIGEPTPYNSDSTNILNFSNPADQERVKKELEALGRIRVPSRSSYFGIIDLAGFPKDRFYLYQSRWRPELPMAHLVPHWTWPDRVGQVTPVQVYTSGDEAEVFLNGKSLGRKKRGAFEYRLYWGDVVYEPGELKAVAYKDGKPWAEDVVRTAGAAAKVLLTPDRAEIRADGQDLSFVTVTIADERGTLVPRSHNLVTFSVEGPGEIVAVDNGDPTSFEPFQARERKAFNGLALVVVRTRAGEAGSIRLSAKSDDLAPAEVTLRASSR